MGTVVVHAGMGKAGSSSIQAWLATHAPELRKRGVDVLVARHRQASGRVVGVKVESSESGNVQSDAVVTAYTRFGADKRIVLHDLLAGLDDAAGSQRTVVLSGEALQRLFWQADEPVLGGLEELAGRHRVRIAYYVRPQHTALEAHWRQWGFRNGRTPSKELAARSNALHYFETYSSTRRLAPSVSFEPRPFRPDLLTAGNPAADFAHTFIGAGDLIGEGEAPRENAGLPLEVVNALRHAPEGLFWGSIHDNARLELVKQVVGELEAPESDSIRRSRLVLQAYSHGKFEADNLRLIEALGWGTDTYVPSVELGPTERDGGLTALDELWKPDASEAELAALYAALDRATSKMMDGRPPSRPDGLVRRWQSRSRIARAFTRGGRSRGDADLRDVHPAQPD